MSGKREILTVAQMRAAEAWAIARGTPESELMATAGAAVAEAVRRRWPVRPVVALCGLGGNGGDGFVAARRLAEAGWPVRVALLGDRAAMRGAAAGAAADWMGFVEPADPSLLAPGTLVIDALFGLGLSRPLDLTAAALARAARNCDVVAVDVPSGIAGDGAPLAGEAFAAAVTVTFLRKKPAHVLEPGREACGDVIVADIGIADAAVEAVAPRAWENAAAAWSLPFPGRNAHKHGRGHVIVMSGPRGRTGAARLAARAALRAGAGLVTVASPASAMAENAAQLTAVMLAPCNAAETLADLARAASAVVIGPAAGVDGATRANVEALLAVGGPLVLDADALTVFADEPGALFGALDPRSVLTPHFGEFRRLFPDVAANAASKIEKVREAAEICGAVVLLKGPDTVIAHPDGRAVVNTTGVPWLATAGSGDVLAGIIAGLIGQGMDAFDAACAGAWLHGRCGEAGGPGLIAEDLPEHLPTVLDALAPAPLRRRRPQDWPADR